MADAAYCPKCGANLPPNAPRGLCPCCLLKGALEAQVAMTGYWPSADRLRDPPPLPEALASDFPELEILAFVGCGGMGMVYKARHKQLDRLVALKILSPTIARDPAFAERFVREARVLALLTHPHVVSIYDFGTRAPTGTDGRDVPLYYFLMEFVDGLTLRQLLGSGELAPPQALAIVPQICEALQFAHDKGVVHRDIKPENILVDRQGNVKIADFGLAKLVGLQGHDVTLSATGQVLGTLHYMAPEQVERPTEVDHRADIYSLGVVFYQMLTGELPLGHFAPPSQKAPVDARLDEVVLRALEKEPARRYQQASALRSQVESIAASSPVVQDELTSPDRRESWLAPSRKWRAAQVAAVIVVIGLACLAAGALVSVGPLRGKFGSGGTNAAASLAVNPYELKLVPNDRVIEAALEKPLSPWAWQELERRSITAGDAETIMDGLTAWLRREHRGGMLDPLSWLARFLRELDARGLVTEPQKISFLEAFHGELRCEPAFRLREGARGLTPKLEWGSNWTHDLFGMTLLNELQSVTIDGEPLPAAKFTAYWNSPTYHQSLPLPPLPAGKHVLHLSVLTALVLTADLVGLISSNVPSTDWPAARKRWNRTIDIELDVFPADAEIISAARNPALDPATHGLSIEPVIIRGTGSRKNATLQFKLDGSLAVPIGFDVSLHIAGQTIPCGSLWRAKNANGGTVLSAEIPQLGADVREADVVLTPNPRLIELRSDVDRFWGGEVSFRNVSLRRLDGAGQ